MRIESVEILEAAVVFQLGGLSRKRSKPILAHRIALCLVQLALEILVLTKLIKLLLVFHFLDGEAFFFMGFLHFFVFRITLLIVLANKCEALSLVTQIVRRR